MKRAVFIFGAGASASAGLPTQAQLLKNYFKSGINTPDSFHGALSSFFKEFFHLDVDSATSFPTFEETLGILELALEKEETFGPNYSLQKLREIRDALIYSMGIAIERKAVYPPTTYHRFINKLFHRGHFQEGEYAFINFNYDVLLDDALMDLMYRDPSIMIDYSISFANEQQEGQRGDFQEWLPVTGRTVNYLKPHGSFNWLHCPTCNSVYILGNQKSQVFKTGYIHKKECCAKDETPLDCVIEPPSFFKKYKNAYLQNIWHVMASLLFEADVVTFIGYSFPDADMWTKYALKRASIGKNKQWIVVNSSEKNERRYRRFLGEVEYLTMDFEEYVQNWSNHHATWR